MKIDESDEHLENAEFPIDERWEPASKVTRERDVHSENDCSQSSWTEEGMNSEESDEQLEKAEFPIDER
jgi:hypothetical protein